MALQTMYDGVVNSPITTITNSISVSDTTIYVLDDTKIPEPPNLLVIGGSLQSAETVLLTAKNGTELTVQRGFQGTAVAWNEGATIARNFTEYDYKTLKENIEDLDLRDALDLAYDNTASGLLATNAQAAIDEVDADLDAHKAEITSQIIKSTRDISITGIQTITTLPNKQIKSIRAYGVRNGTKIYTTGGYAESGGSFAVYVDGTNGNTSQLQNRLLVFSQNNNTDRTSGVIQDVINGSFKINWTILSGVGATGAADLYFIVTYHD